ncbi:MAG: hypothetical protein AAF366_11535, partial [Pseudomonadota bacterium]
HDPVRCLDRGHRRHPPRPSDALLSGSRKYGRTYHLPISPGRGADDKVMASLDALRPAPEALVIQKMNGGTTIIHPGRPPCPSLDTGADRTLSTECAAGFDPDRPEGVMIRDPGAFAEDEIPLRMGKYVHAGHVAPEARHWCKGPITRNGLA